MIERKQNQWLVRQSGERDYHTVSIQMNYERTIIQSGSLIFSGIGYPCELRNIGRKHIDQLDMNNTAFPLIWKHKTLPEVFGKIGCMTLIHDTAFVEHYQMIKCRENRR